MSGIFDAIGIMVKQDGRSIARAGGFDAVAIKVKSQRIMARKVRGERVRARKYGALLVPAAQPAPPMHKAGRMNQTRRALGSGPGGEEQRVCGGLAPPPAAAQRPKTP